MNRLSFPSRVRCIAIAVAAAIGGLLILPMTMPWEWFSVRYDDVDVNSGRIRVQQTLFGVTVSEQVRETWVSRAVVSSGPSDWRQVNTFAFGQGHSPHHRFHGAISQIRLVEMLDELHPFDAQARPHIASELLSRWQHADNDEAADRYIEELSRVALAHPETGDVRLNGCDLP